MTDLATFAFSTCDFCDAHKAQGDDTLGVFPPRFQSWGGKSCFAGPVSTVKCFEDNSLVKAARERPGRGGVRVVDGGGSLRRALVGGNIAAAAAANGWSGVVINGCVRDANELNGADVGIRALALIPMPTERRGEGQADIILNICGVIVRPGDWLYADADGMLVSALPLHGS